MANRDIKYVIGVDGGGSKTALVALTLDGILLARSSTCGINYNFIGVEAAVKNLLDGISALGLGDNDLLAAAIGDPAMDDIYPAPGEVNFRKTLQSALGVPVITHSDAFMALYGLTGNAPGALIVAGTGAMGIALDGSGKIHAVGGWGRLTGDEGGGYFIALSAIKAALRCADGIAPETSLLRAALCYFGCASPRELIGLFYGDGAPELAPFSEEVSRCATAGDSIAEGILRWASKFLADYADSLLRRCPESKLLGVYGSVITHDMVVRDEFERLVHEKHPELVIAEPVIPPETAAAQLAIDYIKRRQKL
jgi:Predicted N-acetylglucosamine kinase